MNRLLLIVVSLGLLGFTACKDTDDKTEKTQAMEKRRVHSEKKSADSRETARLKAGIPSSTEQRIKDAISPEDPSAGLTPPTREEVGDPNEVAVIETAKGDIIIEFFPDLAPLHVANFKKLAKAGFYDGTTFHRVIPNFVLQGGDPNSKDDNPNNDGQGGPYWKVPAEFSDYKHDLGVLSMARGRDVNSAGSQFFICLSRERTKQLDNKYTVFGKVIKGLDVVEKIGNLARDPRKDANKPAVVMRRVRIEKRSALGL